MVVVIVGWWSFIFKYYFSRFGHPFDGPKLFRMALLGFGFIFQRLGGLAQRARARGHRHLHFRTGGRASLDPLAGRVGDWALGRR